MSKNNDRARQKRQAKRRQQQKAKAKERRAAFQRRQTEDRARTKKLARAMQLLAGGTEVPDITDDEYLFWLCHGVNYLVSDADSGLWDPLFEGIYNGVLPSVEDIPNRVMAYLGIDSDEPLTPEGQAVLAWTVTEKSTMRIYKFEAERRILEKNPDADARLEAAQPHQPSVWKVMEQVRQRATQASVADDASVAASD